MRHKVSLSGILGLIIFNVLVAQSGTLSLLDRNGLYLVHPYSISDPFADNASKAIRSYKQGETFDIGTWGRIQATEVYRDDIWTNIFSASTMLGTIAVTNIQRNGHNDSILTNACYGVYSALQGQQPRTDPYIIKWESSLTDHRKIVSTYEYTVRSSGINEIDALDLRYTQNYPPPLHTACLFKQTWGERGVDGYGKALNWFSESAASVEGGSAMQSGMSTPSGVSALIFSGIGHPYRIRFKWGAVGSADDRFEFYQDCSVSNIGLGDQKKVCSTYRMPNTGEMVQSADFIGGTNKFSLAWVFTRGNIPLAKDFDGGIMHVGWVDDVDVKPLRKVIFRSHGGRLVRSIWAEPGGRFDKWMEFPGGPKGGPVDAYGEEGQFRFTGWYDDVEVVRDPTGSLQFIGTGNLITGATIVPEGEREAQNLILHARWEYIGASESGTPDPDKYDKVTYDPNGGDAYPPVIYVSKDRVEGYVPQEPVPECEGYIFDGWYTEPEGGVRIDEATIPQGGQDSTLIGLVSHQTILGVWFTSMQMGVRV